MKKIRFLLICLVLIFIVSGCGNKKVLTCTGMSEGTNMNAYAEVKYTFEKDKLISARLNTTFKDINMPNLESLWSSIKSQFAEQHSPVEVDGFKKSIQFDDKKYTFTVTMEIDYTKISKETIEEYGLGDISTKTYDELKQSLASNENLTCK